MFRKIEIGYVFNANKASLISFPPEPLAWSLKPQEVPKNKKNMMRCPAIIDGMQQHFLVKAPFDITLKLANPESLGAPGKLQFPEPDRGFTVFPDVLKKKLTLSGPEQWRIPSKPITQVDAGIAFVSDTPDVHMSFYPPFMHYNNWPGVPLAGRYNIYNWAGRKMFFAFEWHEHNKILDIKRGDPWFYVAFQYKNPEAKFKLVECELTLGLKQWMDSIKNVTFWVSDTRSLMEQAMHRRPKKLITERK